MHFVKHSHEDSIISIGITSDNKYIVTGSHKTIAISELLEYKEIRYHSNAHEDWVKSIAITSDIL